MLTKLIIFSLFTSKLSVQVRLLCSKLAVHRDEEVRRTLLESIYSIRHGCRDSFKDSLDGLLLDLLLTSQIDTSFSR